jgi:5-hydroxyisourate hydrolase-like protein (transthyretin family)
MRAPLLAVALTLACGGALPAQMVTGRVVDNVTGSPIAGANVSLHDRELGGGSMPVARAVTDEDGGFEVKARRPGTHRLHFEAYGYVAGTSADIMLTPSETMEVEFRLDPGGIVLNPLTVLGRRDIEQGRDGFVRRRDMGRGIFLDMLDIAMLEPKFPSDVFRGIDGIRVDPHGGIHALRGWGCLVVLVDHMPNPVGREIRGSNRWFEVAPPALRAPRAANTPQPGRAAGPVPATPRHPDEPAPPPPLPDTEIGRVRGELGFYELGLDGLVEPRRLRGIEIYRTFADVPRELRESYRSDVLWPEAAMGPCGLVQVWTTIGW